MLRAALSIFLESIVIRIRPRPESMVIRLALVINRIVRIITVSVPRLNGISRFCRCLAHHPLRRLHVAASKRVAVYAIAGFGLIFRVAGEVVCQRTRRVMVFAGRDELTHVANNLRQFLRVRFKVSAREYGFYRVHAIIGFKPLSVMRTANDDAQIVVRAILHKQFCICRMV